MSTVNNYEILLNGMKTTLKWIWLTTWLPCNCMQDASADFTVAMRTPFRKEDPLNSPKDQRGCQVDSLQRLIRCLHLAPVCEGDPPHPGNPDA